MRDAMLGTLSAICIIFLLSVTMTEYNVLDKEKIDRQVEEHGKYLLTKQLEMKMKQLLQASNITQPEVIENSSHQE